MSLDVSTLVKLIIKSGTEFKHSVRKAVGNLGGLEEVTDIIDEEGLKELEEDTILTGTLGDIAGSMILDWASRTCPELPEPSIKVRIWKALARSSRKPITLQDIEEAVSEGGSEA